MGELATVMDTGAGDRQLRWTRCGLASIRSYRLLAGSSPAFCVSTRSSELTLLLEGEVWIDMGPDQRQLCLRPGDGCIVLRGTPHRTQVTTRARMIIVDVQRELWPGLGIVPLRAELVSPALERRMPSLWEQREVIQAVELERWVDQLLARAPEPTSFQLIHNTQSMMAVKRHLDLRFHGAINLEALAREHKLDRYYLARAFRKNFGATPREYLQFLRMEHFAWSLIRPQVAALTQLSSEAGFGDYSTFCRRVQRAFGKPPSELISLRHA